MPPRRRCEVGLPPNITVHPLIIDDEGHEQRLTGPCEACVQDQQQTAAEEEEAVTDDHDQDEDEESDHGEDDLDLLMSGANEENPEFANQMEQAIIAEREQQEREAYAAMAGTVLQQYGRERPVYFNPIFYTGEPDEIREALESRAAYEVQERHIYTGSEDAAFEGESSSDAISYRPDLSGPPGRLRRPERMARYFQRTPDEPYDEPMAWQMQGCASIAEEEMLQQGYGESVTNHRWDDYWDDPNGYAETISTASASSRLEHLGEVESRDQEWHHNRPESP